MGLTGLHEVFSGGEKGMAQQVTTFTERLNEAMARAGMKQIDIIRLTGLSKQQMSQYVNGIFEPKLPALHLLAEVLNVNEVWLMGYDVPEERDVRVDKDAETEKIYQKVMFYPSQVSAGTGAWLSEGREYEIARFPGVSLKADFALKVRGDSMEPMYSDNDIVFIKSQVIVESGQIGVFCLNDEGYLKMLQGNRLVSLNNKYKPIVVDEDDRFFCAGRVIGKVER
jgi:SOS-response transcriptional repressor LexA